MNKLKRGKQSQIINIVQKKIEKKERTNFRRKQKKKNWQLRRKELKLSDSVFFFQTCLF